MDLQQQKQKQKEALLHIEEEKSTYKQGLSDQISKTTETSKKKGLYGLGNEPTKTVTKTKKAAKSKNKPGLITRTLRKMGISKDPVQEELRQRELVNQKINQIDTLSQQQGDVMVSTRFTTVNGVKVPLKTFDKESSNPFLLKMQQLGDAEDQTISPEGKEALLGYKNEGQKGSAIDYHSMNTLLRDDAFMDFQDTPITLKEAYYDFSNFETEELSKVEKNIPKEQKKQEEEKAKQKAEKRYYERASRSKECVKATGDAIKEISKHKLKEDMALFRHTTIESLGVILGLPWGTPNEVVDQKIEEFNKGKTIVHDKAFLSTTMFRDSADNFKVPGGVEVRILAHKGTQAVNISRMKNKKGKTDMMQENEQEMLLQAGTQMRVLKVEKKDNSNSNDPKAQGYVIYMETATELKPLAGKKTKKK